MSAFEIVFNIAGVSITLASLFYLHHLLKTSGRDRLRSPEIVEQFRETAPNHLLEDMVSD